MIQRLVAVSLLLCLAACSEEESAPATGAPLERVTMQVMWVPNAQFAGYYVAQELGYYRDAGIELIIPPYDETISPREVVARGAADFGVDGADQILLGRAAGQSLRAVAAIYRINPAAFAVLEDSGIKAPGDLDGHRVAVLPDATGSVFEAMAERAGVSDRVERVPYGYDIQMLQRGEVDLIPVYVFDEPYLLAQDGVDFDLLIPQDYGIDTYGDTLFTTEALIRDNPDLVGRFTKASLRGWRYAIEHPEETLEIVLRHDHPDYHDPDREAYILDHQAPLVHTGHDRIGWMRPDVWTAMGEMLHARNMIADPLDAEAAYTNAFIDGPSPR